jgi:uncharacterized protein (DUF1778 family)
MGNPSRRCSNPFAGSHNPPSLFSAAREKKRLARPETLKSPAIGRTFSPEIKIMAEPASKSPRSKSPRSKPPHGRARGERLEARVTADQKNLIEYAAALEGRTVTDFVLTSVQDAARRAIEEHQRIELSVRDSQAFVEALLKPRPVNDRLRDTVRRYRQATGV